MKANPFTPGFGSQPPVLVGRDDVIERMRTVFEGFDARNVHWAALLRAHRGAGKTVLLDEIQDLAAAAGWWVLQEDAGAGPPLAARVVDRALARLAELRPPPKRRVTEVGAGGAHISVEAVTPQTRITSVRDVLERLVAAERNGVLLSIDEIHNASDATLDELGNAVQHLHRQRLPFAVVLAGLPTSDRRAEPTFLARCQQPRIGPVDDAEIERGLVETAAVSGTVFEPRALLRAVSFAAGQPYMMQLVGYHAWEHADDKALITVSDVTAATSPAQAEFDRAVTSQIVAKVSPDQRRFLEAMADLGMPARIGDIRERYGWSSQQAGTYRQRLMDAGAIRPAGHGLVEFAIPGLGAYVTSNE